MSLASFRYALCLTSLILTCNAVWTADLLTELRQVAPARGLCLDLAGDGKTAAELAAGTGLLVHSLALSEAACQRTRAAVREAGMAGKAQVELLADKRLPYVDALADVIVVEDAAALEAAGVTADELYRVLAFGGTILSRADDGWTTKTKPWPPDVTQWTHPGHGPDGNRVTAESIPFPVGLRWQDGLPLNIGHWASNRSWVAARGRVFSLTMSELDNITVGTDQRQKRQWLVARSAANGLPLWKLELGTTDDRSDLTPLNYAPLATDGGQVYCRNAKGLIAVDAVSGKVVREYPVAFAPVRLALVEGTLVVAGWEKVLGRKMWDADTEPGSSLWDLWTPAADKGAVEAFDAATGSRRWTDPVPAQTLLVSGQSVVYLTQGPAPVKQQSVVARDLTSGRELWRVSHEQLGGPPTLFLIGAGEGLVALARHKPGTLNAGTRCNQVLALSLRDGSKLWQTDAAGDAFSLLVHGELWYGGQRYEAATGRELGSTGLGVTRGMCVPPVLIGDLGGAPRGGRWSDLADHAVVSSGGVRGACIQGVAVAEGRMYVAQNWCRCAPGQVPGFLALASTAEPTDEDFTAPRPVVRGPGKPATSSSEAPWPTWRAEASRSGVAHFEIPTQLRPRWQADLTPSSDHALADVWRRSLQTSLSAPVTDGSRALVAARNAGEVVALGLGEGKEQWRAGTGARIDSPPTLYGGLCLTPSHDGWVHAFSAADGALAWRTRIAPREQRLVAFGQVESSWPVVGSPLVEDGLGYAVAGRATEMEGGCTVVAFDPATGVTRWATRVHGAPSRRADILQLRDGSLFMQDHRLALADGSALPPPPGANQRPPGNLDGLLDGTWYYVGNRRSGKHMAGQIPAEVLLWTETHWYGYSLDRRVGGCFALSRDAAQQANPKDLGNAAYLWKDTCKDLRVTALALANNALVVAGSQIRDPAKATLRLLNPANGAVLSEIALPATPVTDGLALTPDVVIASLMDGTVLCLAAP